MADGQWVKNFSNISSNTSSFTLKQGAYTVDVIATWGGGTVKLQKLAGDDTTYVDVSTYSSNAYENINLPAGTYRFAVATATGVYAKLSSLAPFV